MAIGVEAEDMAELTKIKLLVDPAAGDPVPQLRDLIRKGLLAQRRVTRLDESGVRCRLRAGDHAGVNTPMVLQYRYMASRAPGAERFPVSPCAFPSARLPLATVGRVRRGLF